MQEPQAKEQWQILCEQAAKEKDPERLMKLVEQINRLLEQRYEHNNTVGAA
jgi:hypothetical protein